MSCLTAVSSWLLSKPTLSTCCSATIPPGISLIVKDRGTMLTLLVCSISEQVDTRVDPRTLLLRNRPPHPHLHLRLIHDGLCCLRECLSGVRDIVRFVLQRFFLPCD